MDFKNDQQQSTFFNNCPEIRDSRIFVILYIIYLKSFQIDYANLWFYLRADPAHLLHLFPAMRKNMFHELLDVEPWHSSFGSSLVDYRISKSNKTRAKGRSARKNSTKNKWKNLKASKKYGIFQKFSKQKIFIIGKTFNYVQQ